MEEIYFKKLGKGLPVILIHGFCETHEIWRGFYEKLAEKFEVWVIDLPGFGGSPLPMVPFSIHEISEKILNWIDRRGIHQPIVIGHSLGGYVALAMAKRDENKIAGLGLFHSTPYPDSDERKANRDRVIEFVNKNGVVPFVDTLVPGLFYNNKHPAILLTSEIARKTQKKTLLAYTVAMRDRPSSVGFLEDFEKPVLVLGGEKDTVIPMESVEEFSRLAKKCTVHVLKDTAHMAMFEMRDEAITIVADFVLKSNLASQGLLF